MFEYLFWVYLVNSVLLINHEIDSAYWKEWKLLKLPGGISGFLVVHFPILFLVMYGLILVFQQTFVGLVFSLFVSLSGIFAFLIHVFLISRGHPEFKVPVSLFILIATFLLSIVQAAMTIYLLAA